jgi:hypothetical protein
LYFRAHNPKVNPTYRFIIEYPFGFSDRLLWELLLRAVEQTNPHLLELLSNIREDSALVYSYGPTVKEFIDNHGIAIRNANTPNDIYDGLRDCRCAILFPDFLDPQTGHVRTQNPAILGPLIGPWVGKGLNFRPALQQSVRNYIERAHSWALRVLNSRPLGGARKHALSIASEFKKILQEERRRLKPKPGLTVEQIEREAGRLKQHLVTFSVDKAANNCCIECIHWYRHTCLMRLLSPAFSDLQCSRADTIRNQEELVEMHTPWEADAEFKPAILFCTAKVHKWDQDPLAYRYVTNGTSAHSNPISKHCTLILTAVAREVRRHCISLGKELNAKLWWPVDSLDIVPFNVDRSHRPNRHPCAFDLERCFESIPLLPEGNGHSLTEHLAFFLEVGMSDHDIVSCTTDWKGQPTLAELNLPGGTLCYTKQDIMRLVLDLLSMAVCTVGERARRQTLGIPMGFPSSVIFLLIYMFKPAYSFVLRMAKLAPQLLPCTHEIYLYIDDLLNMSDLDLRLFLDPEQPQSNDNLFWIFPLAPNGPLGITDQTEYRIDGSRSIVYLDVCYHFDKGQLSFEWYSKCDKLAQHMEVVKYTHWDSNVSNGCKMATVKSQARTAVRSASSHAVMLNNLNKLFRMFLSRRYPAERTANRLIEAALEYAQKLPVQLS